MSENPTGAEAVEDSEELEEGTLLSHLSELRDRLIRIAIAVFIVLVALLPFSGKLFEFASEPLIDVLPGGKMIATQVASPLLAQFKLALYVALFVAMPIVLYQVWAFVAPGLYKKEKRFAIPLLASSIMLFYAGIAFAYYVVFPLIFDFMVTIAPEGVDVQTDISLYLDFILMTVLAFGLAFEVPIATVLIVWTGFTTPARLGKARPYVFLGAFIIGMFLTPPDVISQTLLAVPIYFLYEVGILMSKFYARKAEPEEEPAATE